MITEFIPKIFVEVHGLEKIHTANIIASIENTAGNTKESHQFYIPKITHNPLTPLLTEAQKIASHDGRPRINFTLAQR